MEDARAKLAGLIGRYWHRHGRETPLDGLALHRADAPSGVVHAAYRPSLCVVAQGAKVSMLGGKAFSYSAGRCLLATLDVPVTSRIVEATAAEPYLSLSLTVDPAMVADLLIEQAGALAAAPEFSVLRSEALPTELYDPLIRLLELLDRPRDLPVLAPLIRREIVWHLLNGPLGGTLRQIGLKDGQAARVGRATAWIREHYAEPIHVPALAALAHMSVPSLHRHFKAVTTMTPVQFQKQLRLQEAHRLLLLASQDVASVGYSVGYESPSQFSRDYRRLFGAPPGRNGADVRARIGHEAVL